MLRCLFAAALALTSLVSTVAAQEQDGLLPVEQAFVLRAEIREPGRIALEWTVAPDYYLYKSRISAKTGQPGLSLGALDLPAGIPKHDEFFGDVEIYHGTVAASLPYALSGPNTRAVEFTVTVQGCHEVEPLICYPPHPTTLRLEVPAAPAGAASGGGLIALGGASGGGLLGQVGGQDALPEDQAFVFEAIPNGPGEILARWTLPDGYYLYRDKTEFALEGGAAELGAPRWPPGVDHVDEHFGNVVVYYRQVELPIPLRRTDAQAASATLRAAFQGCKENGICYPVMTRSIALALPALTDTEFAQANAAFVPATAAAAAAGATADASADNALRSQPPQTDAASLAGALLLALLGGLILNLMPCVLPVLSLKVIGLAQSGESLAKARSHALWYTLGVLVSFTAVGLAVIALRAAGQALGWGFQLQQPAFVALLVYVLLAVGLSLSGVFTIGAGLAGTGQTLANRSGPAGDFFTGVLACIVASPCTAPFMGPALGFAFASSSLVALLIFLALGLGLALPFLLIGFVPALASRLPRPGAWMETFKQVLAFPMYLTAVWLAWVLGKQRGVDAIGLVLAGAVVLALGLWWYERSRWSGRPLGRVLALLVVAAALLPLIGVARLPVPSATVAADADAAVPYSAEKLAALRAEGRTVFVNMTADWCVTCKANEKNVLGTDHFKSLLQAADAVYMKGDWTNVDPAITAFLQQHQAVGVPLYVVFEGREGPGRVLPTLLTAGIVEQALPPARR